MAKTSNIPNATTVNADPYPKLLPCTAKSAIYIVSVVVEWAGPPPVKLNNRSTLLNSQTTLSNVVRTIVFFNCGNVT